MATSSRRRRKIRRVAGRITGIVMFAAALTLIAFLLLMTIPHPAPAVQRFRLWSYRNLPIPKDVSGDDWLTVGGPSAWKPQHHSRTELRMAVGVLTRNDPDFPNAVPGGTTLRWDKRVVTYRITLPHYPLRYRSEVVRALEWAALQGGFAVAPAAPGADSDIEVVTKRGDGAFVRAAPDYRTGALYGVRVQLGCCRLRALWEDMTQAFGPLADRADARSLYSNIDEGLIYPPDFDAWVFCLLYSLPPRSSPAELRAKAAELEATRPQRCPVHPPNNP